MEDENKINSELDALTTKKESERKAQNYIDKSNSLYFNAALTSYNNKLNQVKYDWKGVLAGLPYIPVIVLNGNEWIINKLTKVEPNTQLPFTCADNKKYKYCMPYCNRTYEFVYTNEKVDPIYDISI